MQIVGFDVSWLTEHDLFLKIEAKLKKTFLFCTTVPERKQKITLIELSLSDFNQYEVLNQ